MFILFLLLSVIPYLVLVIKQIPKAAIAPYPLKPATEDQQQQDGDDDDKDDDDDQEYDRPPFDEYVPSQAEVSDMKRGLRRLLNKRAMLVAGRLSGSAQDAVLAGSERDLAQAEAGNLCHFSCS